MKAEFIAEIAQIFDKYGIKLGEITTEEGRIVIKEEQKNTGVKNDKGKPRYADFLEDFKEVFEELIKVYEFGTNTYGRENWKALENGEERFSNAMIRHLLKKGINDETGINHQTHTAYNALLRLWYIIQEEKK